MQTLEWALALNRACLVCGHERMLARYTCPVCRSGLTRPLTRLQRQRMVQAGMRESGVDLNKS